MTIPAAMLHTPRVSREVLFQKPSCAGEQTVILDQQESQNFMFGIKLNINDRLNVYTTVFFPEYKNLQFAHIKPPPCIPTDVDQFQTQNIGDAEAQFGNQSDPELIRVPENRINFTLDSDWPLLLGGSVNIDYSYTDEQHEAQEPTANQPALLG